MADPKIKYDIEANVSGDADVGQLASKIEQLASTLNGDLKTSALASAAALRELAQKDGAVQNFVDLKRETQLAAQGLKDAQAAAQRMGAELAAAESPTRSQVGALNKLRDAVRDAKAEVVSKTAALMQARGGLEQYGISTDNLSQSQRNIKTAIAAAKTEVTTLAPAWQGAAAGATSAAAQQEQAAKKMGSGLDALRGQLDSLKVQMLSLVGVGVGVEGVKDLAALADSYRNLEARIKLTTGEGKAFDTAFAGVFDVAKRTSSAVEETGMLFTKLADAGKVLGVSQGEALKLTETINQSIQLSGASAEASKASITQLVQSLQSGVLRGDEFNSVMEQSPRLAKALADGLGVTTAELRKMAETGQLSSATVINSLQKQSDTIASEFGKLPATVGRAMTNLSTEFSRYVGESDKAHGYTTKLATGIDLLAGNLTTVANGMLHAGQTLGAMKLLSMAQDWLAASAAIKTTAEATALATASTVKNTVAKAENTAATAANTAAQAGNAAALTATGIAAKGAEAPITAFGSALKMLKGFAVLDIALNFKSYGTAIGEAAAKLMGYKDRTEELAAAEKTAASIAADNAAQRKRMAVALQEAIDRSFELGKAGADLVTKFDEIRTKGDSASESISKIGKDFDLANVPGIKTAAAVLDKLAADGKLSASEFQAAWSNALKGADLSVFETQARAAFAGTARETERLAQVMDATLRESINRTGLDFGVISGGMGKASRSALNDTDAMIAGLDRLKAMGVDTAQVLTASLGKGISTADSQKAIEAIKLQIESVRKALGDKVADGLLEQAKQKALELKDALDKAVPGITSVREAMKELGLNSRDELQATAKKAEEAYGVIKAKGQEEGESYIAWQARKSDAGRAMLERLIAANGGVITEAIKARAALEGIDLSADRAGKSIKGAFDGGSDAVNRFTKNAGASLDEIKRFEAALDVINAKYGQSKAHLNGTYKLDEQTKATPGRIDLALANKILDATNNGKPVDMTADELSQAQQQAKAAFDAVQTALKNSPGLVSFDAIQSTEALYRASLNKSLVNVTDQASKGGASGSSTANNAATGTPGSPTATVNVRIALPDGSTQIVPTTQSGSQALIAALQSAKLSAGI